MGRVQGVCVIILVNFTAELEMDVVENYPVMLYKYLEIKDFLPKILSGESLRFSCPFDFNDPFESSACYQIENSKAGKLFINKHVKQKYSNPSQRIMAAQQIKNRFVAPCPPDESFNSIIKQVGVCCLSEVRDSVLMWSHYANEHKGICIGFDTSKSMFQLAFQIEYQDKFPIISRPSDSDNTLLKKYLLTKSLCWAYEKEWRIIKRTLTEAEKCQSLRRPHLSEEDILQLTDGRGPGDYGFPKDAIKEIYLGARIDAKQRQKVLQYVRDANLNVSVYEVRTSLQSYNLEFSRFKQEPP
jgi:hypothetical protein